MIYWISQIYNRGDGRDYDKSVSADLLKNGFDRLDWFLLFLKIKAYLVVWWSSYNLKYSLHHASKIEKNKSNWRFIENFRDAFCLLNTRIFKSNTLSINWPTSRTSSILEDIKRIIIFIVMRFLPDILVWISFLQKIKKKIRKSLHT